MKFRPTIEKLESRDLAAPFLGQRVIINIPPGIPYPVIIPMFPSSSLPKFGPTLKR